MQRDHNGDSLFSISGWLFADMFLALMMIFIVASTIGVYEPEQPLRPKPTPSIKGIDSSASYITITIDAAALQENDPAAIQAVKDQVKHQLGGKQNAKAGLVLTFGGGPDQQQDTDVAQRVNAVLRSIGAEHFVFDNASYDAYIDLGNPLGTVTIKIYFFVFGNVTRT